MLTMTIVGVAGGAATAGVLSIVRVFAEGFVPRMTAHSQPIDNAWWEAAEAARPA
jgi:hypothetical protein